jgi:serine/threonine protein kinase
MELKIKRNHDLKLARCQEEIIMSDNDISFQLGKIIGQGTFGKVYEAMNTKTGEMYAIKRIDIKPHKATQMIAMAKSEIDLMKKLRHPHIVGVKGSALDGNIFHVIMDLIPGRSLADSLITLGPFHNQVIKKFTKQLLEALVYCHKNNCIHRDIKGKNILMAHDGSIMLCDFGSAKIKEEIIDKDAVSGTYSYTPLWVAPETLNQKLYNDRVDIWALG